MAGTVSGHGATALPYLLNEHYYHYEATSTSSDRDDYDRQGHEPDPHQAEQARQLTRRVGCAAAAEDPGSAAPTEAGR